MRREVAVSLPGLRLVSLANQREHWRPRASRARRQRATAKLLMQAALRESRSNPLCYFPLSVVITRIAPRALDCDNLAGAAKSVRDGVADALGIDDRDPRVKWAVAQRRGGKGEYGAEITLSWDDPDAVRVSGVAT